MQIKKKIAAAIVSGSIIGAVMLPVAALADTGCEISGNGAHSHNSCTIRINRRVKIRQSNSSTIRNRVWVDVDTGGNRANNNTGGDVTITTGEATSSVTITNEVNQ